MASNENPPLDESTATDTPAAGRKRGTTVSSIAQSVQTAADIIGDVLSKDPPPGFFAAAADTASHAPTVSEIRRGSFGSQGWHIDSQRHERRQRAISSASGKGRLNKLSLGSKDRPTLATRGTSALDTLHALHEEPHATAPDVEPFPNVEQSVGDLKDDEFPRIEAVETQATIRSEPAPNQPLAIKGRIYSSGYIPPAKVPWTTAMSVGSKAFGKWVITPFGFFWTLYGLNVVAWGGMLFLLLIGAAPAMCYAPLLEFAPAGEPKPVASLIAINDKPRYRNCNDIFSPRRIWLEIDSQVLNALFCVTGFGLLPWRLRDLWYLLRFRLTSSKKCGLEHKMYGLRKLAGFYRTWFRLPGSNTLDLVTLTEYKDLTIKSPVATTTHIEPVEHDWTAAELRLPLPVPKTALFPATGIRAPPTPLWKMDLFVWCQIANTGFQVVLCGFMWGMTRYNRPSWATGLFIALACIIAAVGGIVSYLEGSKVKRVEGVMEE